MENLILFGAGASYGSGDVRVNGKRKLPPLGNQLFNELVSTYPRWASLPEVIKTKFVETENFEQGMLLMKNMLDQDRLLPDPGTAHQYFFGLIRDMCRYFLQFKPGPKSVYRAMKHCAFLHANTTVFATLNYDDLLEQSLVRYADKIGRIQRENKSDLPLILKLHGGPRIISDRRFKIRTQNAIHNGILCDTNTETVKAYEALRYLDKADAEHNDMACPAIALYAPGKPVLHNRSTVTEAQRAFAYTASKVSNIYVIGARCVADQHIWNPLISTDAQIVFVNKSVTDISEFKSWADANGVKKYETVESDFATFVKDRFSTSGIYKPERPKPVYEFVRGFAAFQANS